MYCFVIKCNVPLFDSQVFFLAADFNRSVHAIARPFCFELLNEHSDTMTLCSTTQLTIGRTHTHTHSRGRRTKEACGDVECVGMCFSARKYRDKKMLAPNKSDTMSDVFHNDQISRIRFRACYFSLLSYSARMLGVATSCIDIKRTLHSTAMRAVSVITHRRRTSPPSTGQNVKLWCDLPLANG